MHVRYNVEIIGFCHLNHTFFVSNEVSMKKIKIGIVGMGMIGNAHWDALRRIPEVTVAAIADVDPAKTEQTAKRLDIPMWFTSYASMIAHVDVVHNCTPNHMHTAVNHCAIAAGKHIYAEKPLSYTADEAFALWRGAEEAGVLHGLNHQYRMHAAVQEMRARVQQGDIGRVFLLSGRYHQQSGLYPTDFSERMVERNGVWALADIGTHWVDAACCVLGKRIEKVFASIQTTHTERTRPDGERVQIVSDDLSAMLLAFEGGAKGSFTVSKVSAGHLNDLALGVDGQHYSMLWEQETPDRLHLGFKHAPNTVLTVSPDLVHPAVADLVTLPGGHPPGWNDALYLSVREFYRALRGEISSSAMRCATFEDGFEGMAFIEAALQSEKTGQWVTLRWPMSRPYTST